jgi:hypothetical protein
VVLSSDTYQDEDGNVWLFDPPYEDEEPNHHPEDE